jgi:hypothetical protein
LSLKQKVNTLALEPPRPLPKSVGRLAIPEARPNWILPNTIELGGGGAPKKIEFNLPNRNETGLQNEKRLSRYGGLEACDVEILKEMEFGRGNQKQKSRGSGFCGCEIQRRTSCRARRCEESSSLFAMNGLCRIRPI